MPEECSNTMTLIPVVDDDKDLVQTLLGLGAEKPQESQDSDERTIGNSSDPLADETQQGVTTRSASSNNTLTRNDDSNDEISLALAMELLSQLANMDSTQYQSALQGCVGDKGEEDDDNNNNTNTTLNNSLMEINTMTTTTNSINSSNSSNSSTPARKTTNNMMPHFESLYHINNSTIWTLTSAVHRLQSNLVNVQIESDQQAIEIQTLKQQLIQERQQNQLLESKVQELMNHTNKIHGKVKKVKSEKKRLIGIVHNFWSKLQDSEHHLNELEELKVAYRLQAHENALLFQQQGSSTTGSNSNNTGRVRTHSTDTISSEAMTLEFMTDADPTMVGHTENNNNSSPDNQDNQSVSAHSTCSSLVTDEGIATVRLAAYGNHNTITTHHSIHPNQPPMSFSATSTTTTPSFSILRNRTFSEESELSMEPMIYSSSKLPYISPRGLVLPPQSQQQQLLSSVSLPETYTLTFQRGQKVGLQIRAIPIATMLDENLTPPTLVPTPSQYNENNNKTTIRPRSHPSLLEAFAETRMENMTEEVEDELFVNNKDSTTLTNQNGTISTSIKGKPTQQQQQHQTSTSQNPFRHFSVNSLNPFAGMMGSNNNNNNNNHTTSSSNNITTTGPGSAQELDDALSKKNTAIPSSTNNKVNNLNPFAGMMGSNHSHNSSSSYPNNNNNNHGGGTVASSSTTDNMDDTKHKPPPSSTSSLVPKLQVFLVCGYSQFDDERNVRPPVGSRIVAVHDKPIPETFTMKELMALLTSFSHDDVQSNNQNPDQDSTSMDTTRPTTYTITFRNEPLTKRQRELLEKPSHIPLESASHTLTGMTHSNTINDGISPNGIEVTTTSTTVKSETLKQSGISFNFLPAGMLSPLNMNRPVGPPSTNTKSMEQVKQVNDGPDRSTGETEMTQEAEVIEGGTANGGPSRRGNGPVFFMPMPNVKNKDSSNKPKQRKNLGERFAHSMGLGSTPRGQSPIPGEDVVDL